MTKMVRRYTSMMRIERAKFNQHPEGTACDILYLMVVVALSDQYRIRRGYQNHSIIIRDQSNLCMD